MTALAINQQDLDKSSAAMIEVKQILLDGATVGGVEKIAEMFTGSDPTDEELAPVLLMLEAVAVALVRIAEPIGVPPVQLPTYTALSLPPASDNTGSVIYVSDGAAGLGVMAFCDGSDWLRVDTRTAVSPT